MRYFISYILLGVAIFFGMILQSFAAINFSIDPLKYELEMAPGDSLTLTASIRNNGDTTVTMPTAVSDFQANGTGGAPSFVRRSELVFPDQELSSWITLSAPEVTMLPGEKATINFTIDVPENAIPGGHYGAVIFKNPGSETSTGGNVGINVDYGIIILITVDGDIIIDGEVGEIVISGGATGRPKPTREKQDSPIDNGSQTPDNTNPETSVEENNVQNEDIGETEDTGEETNVEGEINDDSFFGITPPGSTLDDCPLGDFTSSNFDGKCFDNPFSPEIEERNTDTTNMIPLGQDEDFGIGFRIPFKNTGTTHVKPTGKIILEDSEGNQLKSIGREVIVNDLGVIIGENVVDYIPINDTDGNVLPNTNRIFEGEWEGFPYKTYDNEGNEVIEHWTPSEYYTRKNQEEAGFVMFWERVCEAKRYEKITALMDVSYTNQDGEVVEFNAARDFYIDYTEKYIGINPYVVLPLFIFLILLGLFILWKFFFIIGKKKRVCKNCDTPVRKNWHVCPKCKKKLKK